MITLTAVNKYYNKRKNNELHVLKNISLSLNDQGMVVLLGPSGSGKTTLLNVIGGLDSTHSGEIECLDETFTKYDMKAWDSLRAKDIGVIFQNYNLINQETVYENIAITLRMLGYRDETIIEERVMRLLEAVKMERFYKRRAIQLSGGQQQRVAIARALAKKPKLLLTDEPTGNLDSKNTYDVMRILRKVADQTLVIMVTHEEALATQFADRILRLEDGQIISDEANTPKANIHQYFDGDIYLGDFAHESEAKSPDQSVQLYSDEPVKDPLNITLVMDQDTLYFKVDKPGIKKIIQVEDDSDIRFKSGKREGAMVEASDDYDLSALDEFEKKASIKNVLDLKNTIRLTLQSITQSSRGMKFLYAGFILTGALIALSIGFLNTIINVPEDTVRVYPDETVLVETAALSGPDALTSINDAYQANYGGMLMPFIQLATSYELNAFPLYQASNTVFGYGSFFPGSLLNSEDLLHGRLPSGTNEIVIDRIHAEELFNNNTLTAYGLEDAEVFIGLSINVLNTSFEIVGISDGVANGIFVDAAGYSVIRSSQLQGARVYDSLQGSVSLFSGIAPETSNDLLLSAALYPDTVPATFDIEGQSFNVIGTYTSETVIEPLIAMQGADRIVFSRLSNDESVGFYATDAAGLESTLNARAIAYEDALEITTSETRQNNIQNSIGLLVFTLIALGASALSFYFIIRSSLIERVKEIGIYRSLGIRSLDIMKLFVVEALIISTLTSLIGFIGMSLVLNQIQQATRDIIEVISVTSLSVLMGVAFIYLVNLIAGLFPVFGLLRKTPSTILVKYDI